MITLLEITSILSLAFHHMSFRHDYVHILEANVPTQLSNAFASDKSSILAIDTHR